MARLELELDAVRKRVQVEKWVNEPKKRKITGQPNIRVFKLQEMSKKFKLYVGKTIVRRARAQVLNNIMGDHIVKFGRILDYKDEMLRTNLRTSYAVKLGEPDALGKLLLVDVANNGNNQILLLAWVVFEKENRNSWTMFVKCIKDDLGLGDGEGLTLITNMHKIAKSTFESQLRKNIKKTKLLGSEKMMGDLMYYNINYWYKIYFNTEVKCDSIDNNVFEYFNIWILTAGHKTIITMLEKK
ncbi:hypothetical protein H5410_052272 [Solanum commersonii]|uniref:MULE transposase domain-containing protein n=1 Tax=Solanum commersonii TaxID=4109 RepID=A0A9J5X2I8_SOLCO|nr:hypothetical protein H5410_052272 [Solanum commersonii]